MEAVCAERLYDRKRSKYADKVMQEKHNWVKTDKIDAQRLAKNYESARILQLDVVLQISFTAYFKLLDEMTKLRRHLLKKLQLLCKKERYRESVTIKKNCPGVGWLSAIRFTLEWGDMSRFPTRKRFASFTGLTSSEFSTGDTIQPGG